jgi:transposase
MSRLVDENTIIESLGSLAQPTCLLAFRHLLSATLFYMPPYSPDLNPVEP